MTTTYKLREGLPELPSRMKGMTISEKGYPVPYFVAYVDGKPDFRVVDEVKLVKAVRQDLCWICGQKLGKYKVFVGGSLMLINRVSAEPPCHHDCALFAVKACPFLLLPKAQRRDAGLPQAMKEPTGMLKHNPTVSILYTTTSYSTEKQSHGALFRIADPQFVEWYTGGNLATREQATDGLKLSVSALMQQFEDTLTQRERKHLQKAMAKAVGYLPTL